MNPDFWENKRVFLTGHTGFKGGWLALCLRQKKAEVYGYSLVPETKPNFFEVCQMSSELKASTLGDLRDAKSLREAMQQAKPEIVFHLAAQPLVRRSYEIPEETFAVNVMGTLNLYEAIRATPEVRSVINVTTDKCYENRNWIWSYRENEALGGHDPYSSSKACSELLTSAYRQSYFNASGVSLASARAGNVIGGGDWAADRLVPDFFRAADSGQELGIRYPEAVRPWQHVLEPLRGYLTLAEKLYQEGTTYAEAWNFGPEQSDSRSVRWIVDYLGQHLPAARWSHHQSNHPHEAAQLRLDSSKANARLHWHSCWNLEKALEKTLDWHQAWKKGGDMKKFSCDQIQNFHADCSS